MDGGLPGWVRGLAAGGGGLLAALALFTLVAAMVRQGSAPRDLPPGLDTVAFVQTRPAPPEPPPRDLPPEPPPPPADPPPPPPPLPQGDAGAGGIALALPTPHLHLDLSAGPDLSSLKGAGDREVVAVSTPRPAYPVRAQRLGLSGRVVVEFTVAEDGSVRDPKIISADPPRIFDRAVLRGVRRWRFQPRVENGRPVPVRIRQTVVFSPAEDPS